MRFWLDIARNYEKDTVVAIKRGSFQKRKFKVVSYYFIMFGFMLIFNYTDNSVMYDTYMTDKKRGLGCPTK